MYLTLKQFWVYGSAVLIKTSQVFAESEQVGPLLRDDR